MDDIQAKDPSIGPSWWSDLTGASAKSGLRIGNTAISPDGLIESGSVSVAELAHVLDVLLIAGQVKKGSWEFADLVDLLDHVTKVNPHQHITGSIGDAGLLRRVIQVYRQDQSARDALLDYLLNSYTVREEEIPGFFQQSDAELVQWFQRKIPLPGDPWDFDEADNRLNLTRLAFQSTHPDTLALLQQAYYSVALENAEHGVEEVWFRTSLGDHESDSFVKAAGAALKGAKSAQSESSVALRVRYMVGMRKHTLDSTDNAAASKTVDPKAEGLVASLQALRGDSPATKRMILGVDSVGMDSRWLPHWQAKARRAAARAGLRVALHFGESWREGELLERLKVLKGLVELGIVHQLDNANALFAVKDLGNNTGQYSNDQWAEIRQTQRKILEAMIKRGIALGINPTSNDVLTRSLRYREGWRFRELSEPLGVGMSSVVDLMLDERGISKHLMVVVGNDNSRLYGSRIPGGLLTVSEELANLWEAHGSSDFSIFGKVSTEIIARLISNGFAVGRSTGDDLLDAWPSPSDLYPEASSDKSQTDGLASIHSGDIDPDFDSILDLPAAPDESGL